MSIVPAAPRGGAPDPTAAANALRALGLRVSAARRLILEALWMAEDPVTAEAIAGGLGGRLPVSDRASTYRNLATMEAAGLVRHLHAGHGAGRWEHAGRPARAYVGCEACGTLTALTPAAAGRLRDAVRAACGHEAALTHFPLVGRCPACAER
jgi:Fur family transcriptional regulator, ferric uptake regulator